jgi:hypothetical protein
MGEYLESASKDIWEKEPTSVITIILAITCGLGLALLIVGNIFGG